MSIVKSFSVGNGDMFYIRHDSDNFTIIDCYMNDGNKKSILNEIHDQKSEKDTVRFISTHPDEDHLQGLAELDKTFFLFPQFYYVENEARKAITTEDFRYYCSLRDGIFGHLLKKGCERTALNGTGITVLWPDMNNDNFKEAQKLAAKGEAFNNLSPIFTYASSCFGVKIMWMGDMEHDFLEKIKDEVDWPLVDILFAPHHGRRSGKVPESVLKKLLPQVVVIGEGPSEYLNYYKGYNTITQNSAGDIIFDCEGEKAHIYVSTFGYHEPFLTKEKDKWYAHGAYYLGTLTRRGVYNAN